MLNAEYYLGRVTSCASGMQLLSRKELSLIVMSQHQRACINTYTNFVARAAFRLSVQYNIEYGYFSVAFLNF